LRRLVAPGSPGDKHDLFRKLDLRGATALLADRLYLRFAGVVRAPGSLMPRTLRTKDSLASLAIHGIPAELSGCDIFREWR
jgi:hypothetical protein